VQSFPITLVAFSGLFAKAAHGAWIHLVCVVLFNHLTLLWLTSRGQEIRDMDHKLFERGRGNVCSVEASTFKRRL
jgi:hypothetical protein